MPLAVALLTSSIAVAAPVARAGAQPATALAAADALLDVRERAFAAGDVDAWMATVDPEAPPRFRDAQRRQFRGLRSTPVEAVQFDARIDDTGDLAPEAERFLPETRMTYRLGGFDDRNAVESMYLTYVERGDRWYVAADEDAADLGLDTSRGLWDFGDVGAITTEHFLVLHHPEQAPRAEALAAIAEDALVTMQQRWSRPWAQRIPIILPGSVDELEQLLQSTIDLDKFVAFVSYNTYRDESWFAAAPRMYIQDRRLSAYGRDFQVETLVHELVHAATAPLAGPSVSAWVHEGVADWVATGRGTREPQPSGSDGVLPRDFEFTTGSQQAIIRSYAESRSFISYVASRAGLDAPAAFFAAAGEDKMAAGSIDHRIDAALRASTTMGLADAQSAWADNR